jgi:hypothetical protein
VILPRDNPVLELASAILRKTCRKLNLIDIISQTWSGGSTRGC